MEFQGIEKISFVDWEGKICTTLFTGSCNFRCPFCHNAKLVENQYQLISEEEIFNHLKERRKVIDGVVVSGGEPTLQSELPEFLKKLKYLGFAVKLDTNGTNPDMLKYILDNKLVDYVAMDIKNNFEAYQPITATKKNFSSLVKESLNFLRESGVDYELRTTLVGEFHNENNIQLLAQDLKGEKLLYLQKYVASENCFDSNLTPVSLEKAKNFQTILAKTITSVNLRGY